MVKRHETAIDGLLAAALRGETPSWPDKAPVALGVERILYHGIAGLIADRASNLTWPCALLEPVRGQAIAQAMWEMRHKPLLSAVLTAFAEHGINALLLKGSAMAYDLYLAPASRSRGDSDVLIAAADLDRARLLLSQLGFDRQIDGASIDDLALQEVWSTVSDSGMEHHIDLHWQLLNAPALRGVLEFATCAAAPIGLRRLGSGAQAMNRILTLLHTCIHRAMHITSPYFVDGVTYYGGDRLIWANDLHLLASALSEADWDDFTKQACAQGVAAVGLNGLEIARSKLGTTIPTDVIKRLALVGHEPASAYLLSAGQIRRSWADLLAMPGWRRRLAYAAARALPSPQFMRRKYPNMVHRPLAALYGRRVIDLLRPRPNHSGRA